MTSSRARWLGIRTATLTTALLMSLAGCGSDGPMTTDHFSGMVADAGVNCVKWETAFRDTGSLQRCVLGSGEAVNGLLAPSESQALRSVAETQYTGLCLERSLADTPENARDALDEPYVALHLGNWAISGPAAAVEAIRGEVGGDLYERDDPFPAGFDQAALAAEAPGGDYCGDGQADDATSPAPAATSAVTPSSEDSCVEDCTWSIGDVLDDLGPVLCGSQDPAAALTNDITALDPLALGADVIRVCSSGGSIDLSGYGVAHVWGSYAGLEAALPKLVACPWPGVTVIGGSTGAPGFAVTGIQTGHIVVRALVERGGRVVCGA